MMDQLTHRGQERQQSPIIVSSYSNYPRTSSSARRGLENSWRMAMNSSWPSPSRVPNAARNMTFLVRLKMSSPRFTASPRWTSRRGLVVHCHPRLRAPPAEELHRAQLAHLPPEGPVVRERHVGAVVGQQSTRWPRWRGGSRTRRPAPRARTRASTPRTRAAGPAGGAGVQQPAVLLGQRCQPAVGQLVHHRHVPDDRQRLQARRQRRLAPPPKLQEHDGQRGHQHPAQRVLEPLHRDLGYSTATP
jgi:hypothetical protein